MESRLKAFGHAIHPMLIPFPLGLLSTAVTFDIIHFITGTTVWSDGAFYMIAAGIIGGLAAAIFGLIDWLAIPSGTRAKAVGLYHGGGNVVVVVLFALSWLLRYGDYSHPSGIAFILALLAVGLATMTAWLGGELVERLRVGVDEGANLNAPSSLSRQRPKGAFGVRGGQ